jgi:hypothetical protein
MRIRSGRTAWGVALGLGWTAACVAGARAGVGDPVENQVNLVLQISGLGADGCVIEVKPGHPSCKFEPVARRVVRAPVNRAVQLDAIPIQAVSTGADRDCSFAITIREPGQPPRTYRRGLRLTAQVAGEPVPSQTLRCYLSTPSLAEREKDAPKRR